MAIPAIPPATRLYRLVSCALWPLLYGGGLLGAYFAFGSERPMLWFNVVYLSVALTIGVFERLMPYARQWFEADGEAFNDVAHTLMSKGLVQVAAVVAASFPMLVAMFAQPALAADAGLWPRQWPLFAQVVLGLLLAELGLYFAHRLAHERLTFWRFHALHHSVVRLWVVNTGRFHVVDSIFKAGLSQIPLYLLGAPLPVFLWIGAVTAFTGLLTHCNVDVRTGWLDRIFSTPRLHRWHHSRRLEEGNTNYCENLVLWDQVFGTYYDPPRPSPTDIGISGKVPARFLAQVLQPFSARGLRQILGRRPRAEAVPIHRVQVQPE